MGVGLALMQVLNFLISASQSTDLTVSCKMFCICKHSLCNGPGNMLVEPAPSCDEAENNL